MASAAEVFRQRLVDLARSVDPERIIYSGQGSPEPHEASRGSRYTHIADHYEFVYPAAGEAMIELPDRVVELHAGDVLLIERGVTHSEIMADPLHAYVVFWFHVRHNSALLTETHFAPPATWKPVGPLVVSGRVDVEAIAAAIGGELASQDWGWQGSIRGLLHYLCAIVIRRLDREGAGAPLPAEAPAIQADPRTWSIVRSVLEYCEQNYRRGIGLNEVSAALGYSPSYLSRLVTRHLGRSLSDHLHSRRIEAAKRFLEDPQLSVGEVAAELGYSDPAHFTRAFNKATGISPTAYRHRLGGL